MSIIASQGISSEIEEQFVQGKQLRWEDFTPERISIISSLIDDKYVPGVGIQASDLCHILYGYYPARKTYEGICYYLFNLVATKDGKGHIFFIKKSEIGTSTFPVVQSIWHNLDTMVKDEEFNTLSDARKSLENQWNKGIDKTTLNSALSELLNICSKISKVLSKID